MAPVLAVLTAWLPGCQRAKTYHEQAKAAGVPAITTAGIYPGTSNVMAAHLVSLARRVRHVYRRCMTPPLHPSALALTGCAAVSGTVHHRRPRLLYFTDSDPMTRLCDSDALRPS